MHGRRPAVIALLGLIFLGPASVFAQQEAATIIGEVRDPSGAVIPNAAVTITNVDTNISIAVVTNDRGSYTVPNLRPGNYSLTAEAAGFTRMIRTGLTLQV